MYEQVVVISSNTTGTKMLDVSRGVTMTQN